MALVKPRHGKITYLAKSHDRALIEQAFYYPKESGEEKREIFSLWRYMKRSPVRIFPVTLDRRVVAIRQFRHGSDRIMLEVPGGLPKDEQTGEDVVTSAARELLEETGFQAAHIVDLRREVWSDSAAHNLQFRLLVGLRCQKVSEPKLDRTEVIETVLVPIKQWYEKIERGEINDNCIIAISHLAIPHIGGRIDL